MYYFQRTFIWTHQKYFAVFKGRIYVYKIQRDAIFRFETWKRFRNSDWSDRYTDNSTSVVKYLYVYNKLLQRRNEVCTQFVFHLKLTYSDTRTCFFMHLNATTDAHKDIYEYICLIHVSYI